MEEVIFFSDTHISKFTGLFHKEAFYTGAKLINRRLKANPNAIVLHLGDITDSGTYEDFLFSQKILNDSFPDVNINYIPGNHDMRNIGDQLWSEFFGERQFIIDTRENGGNLVILGIDSSEPDENIGRIGDRGIEAIAVLGAYPDELFVTLALRDFEIQTSILQAVYVVEWSYNYHHYGVVVHTDPSGIGFFLVGQSDDGDSDLDQWDVCSGTYDPDADTITWELSKEAVGHPPPAGRLTNTQAHTHLRFTTESGLPRGDLFKDLTHNAKSVQDYTIKY